MTTVLAPAASSPLRSLNGSKSNTGFDQSSVSLSSQKSLGYNEEDDTIKFKKSDNVGMRNSLDDLQFLAISAQITEVGYSISDIQTRIFAIQELRHTSDAQQAPSSSAHSTDGPSTSGAAEGSTANIDQALINLDEKMESVAASIASIDSNLAPFIAASKSSSSTNSVDLSDPVATLIRKHTTLLQDWDSVQEEAETLKGELREDKWLAVFRTVGEQAEAMMVSLEKAIALCQEFIWQVYRNRKALTDDGHSGVSSGSMSGEKPINYEMFQSLQSSYEAKKRYYMPATTKVLAILDRSVRDRVTKNGECLRRHAEARARWKNLRERINRIDSEMESVRLFFVNKEKEQEPEPSEAGSVLSRQTSKSNFTTKSNSNYLSTPASGARSRAGSSSGTPSAFSRSMSPLKRFASKVTASVRSNSSVGRDTPSRNTSTSDISSPQSLRPVPISTTSSITSNNAPGAPKPPPRSPFRPLGNKISAVSSAAPPAAIEVGKEKKKRDSSIFPFLSKPPPSSTLSRSALRSPSRSSLSGGDTSSSAANKPKWNPSTKVDEEAANPQATIRASPARPSITNQTYMPSNGADGRRSLSRSEIRPSSSMARHTPWNSVSGADYKNAPTPSRPPSRSQSRAGARTPSGMYGTNPRTRPQTPSHIPAPVSYFNLARSPSRAASESDLDDMEFPTSLMQRAFTPSADRGFATPDPGRKRRPSNSLIPVPTLNITSNSRPGTALSMNDADRSGSPSQDGHGRRSPRESPSAWREGSAFKESPSNPFKDSSPAGRAGARSQTPEAMLRSRAMQTPVYLDNSSLNEKNATPSGRPRASAPSSFKGPDGKTLVFGPGGSGNPNEGGRGPSRPTSRSANYGFGRMTPGLDGPGPTYIPTKTDELDVEVANVVNGMPHGFLFERVDPPRRTPAKAGEEVKAQYAMSNALGRKVITCRLVTVTRGGVQTKKVMCRVGGGWLDLQMYILNRQAGLS